ncbi:MAG: hypothetical protein PHV57_03740 [Methanomicrobiaceae archaeon]|nr:hypothetical protein [Methanomicrobiaceae archaeon]
MGKICSPFIVLECARACGFSRVYNRPTEEQQKEITELTACPLCGGPIRRIVF